MRWRVRFVLFACLATALSSVAVVVDAPRAEATLDVPADDACGPQLLKPDGTTWECTFVDEFSGDALDRNRWTSQQTSVSGMTNGTGGCYVDKPSTIRVAKGRLRLTARQLDRQMLCRSPYGSFRTNLAAATVTTRGRFSQAYGRFEFRAKVPALRVSGAHSTMWLYPDKHTYGPWPLSGEIDVAEWFSVLSDRMFPSLHYVDGVKDVATGMDANINPSRFHTYAVEWTPTVMRFYYDGGLAYEHAWSPLAPLVGSQPFDRPFNVVLTQAWGGLWNAITAETPRRVTMVVDRVRVWK